jgi:hypothetical protein
MSPAWLALSNLAVLSQFFFTGAAVLMNALGGHSIAMEMMDAMQTPRQVNVTKEIPAGGRFK